MEKSANNSKSKFVLGSCLLAIAIFTSGVCYFLGFTKSGKKIYRLTFDPNYKCVTAIDEASIKGGYLKGLYDADEKIEIYMNYYKCKDISLGDTVAMQISTELEPVYRVVRGISGDSFQVLKDQRGRGWNLLINDKQVMFNGQAYYFGNPQREPILLNHAKMFKNKVGKDMVILLSEVPRGSQDSGSFGLISTKKILGKVGREPAHVF